MMLLSCGIIYAQPKQKLHLSNINIGRQYSQSNELADFPTQEVHEIPDKIQSLKFMDTVLSCLGEWVLGPKISLYCICTEN